MVMEESGGEEKGKGKFKNGCLKTRPSFPLNPTEFTNIQNLCFLLPHGPDLVCPKPDRFLVDLAL